MATLSAASLRTSSFTGERLAAPRAAPAPASRPAALSVQAVQTLIGEVVSNKCAKSVVIRVDRQVPHPKYMKRVTLSKKYMAHDEEVRLAARRVLAARQRGGAYGGAAARPAARPAHTRAAMLAAHP